MDCGEFKKLLIDFSELLWVLTGLFISYIKILTDTHIRTHIYIHTYTNKFKSTGAPKTALHGTTTVKTRTGPVSVKTITQKTFQC